MARLVNNGDGTLNILLDPVEDETVSNLPPEQLESYITIWLREHAGPMFQLRFEKLPPEDQAIVLQKLRGSR